MNIVPTIGKVLRDYKAFCEEFERLLHFPRPPITPYQLRFLPYIFLPDGRLRREDAEKLIVLWIYCQQLGTTFTKAPDDVQLAYRVLEGQAALFALLHFEGNPPVASPYVDVYHIREAMGEIINRFRQQRDLVIRGMAAVIRSGVPALIFNDVLRGLALAKPETLNDIDRACLSQGFVDMTEPETEAQRSLLFFFPPKDGPLNWSAVLSYFLRKWGTNCIESWTDDHTGRRILFRQAAFLELSLPVGVYQPFVIEGRIMFGFRPVV